MSNVHFIADLHLGHESMAVHRGFESADHMAEEIIRKWNQVVHKRDLVYILGDVTMESKKHYHLLDQLLGRKVVVLGNHDLRNHAPELLKHVDQVAGIIKYKGYFLTHCPVHPMEFDYRIKGNIHGHLHEKVIEDSRYIGVSCEQVDYQPVKFEEWTSEK